jgi:hypothetical protein
MYSITIMTVRFRYMECLNWDNKPPLSLIFIRPGSLPVKNGKET